MKKRVSFPSDKELIARINNNDPAAKNILCRKYIAKCHKLAAKYHEMYPAIGSKEDFFSIAIEILGHSIESFNYSHAMFENYFLACVEHKIQYYIKKNYDQKMFEKQVLSLDYRYNDGSCLYDACGAIDNGIEQNILKDTFVNIILEPINGFKPREREVMFLYLEGNDLKEICNILQLRYSSIYRYYTISLRKLKNILSRKR